MPILYILAGANGTGKTTYYLTAVQQGFISKDLPFLNIDFIIKNELGDFSAENIYRAENIFRQRASDLIKNRNDFMIESNLAQSNDYAWIEKLIRHGYEAVIYFMCTGDVNINVSRVQRRVKEGGHNIPVEIILHRYEVGLTYISGKMHLFKEAYLIDNSSDEVVVVAKVWDEKLVFAIHHLPRWADKILYITKRMQK